MTVFDFSFDPEPEGAGHPPRPGVAEAALDGAGLDASGLEASGMDGSGLEATPESIDPLPGAPLGLRAGLELLGAPLAARVALTRLRAPLGEGGAPLRAVTRALPAGLRAELQDWADLSRALGLSAEAPPVSPWVWPRLACLGHDQDAQSNLRGWASLTLPRVAAQLSGQPSGQLSAQVALVARDTPPPLSAAAGRIEALSRGAPVGERALLTPLSTLTPAHLLGLLGRAPGEVPQLPELAARARLALWAQLPLWAADHAGAGLLVLAEPDTHAGLCLAALDDAAPVLGAQLLLSAGGALDEALLMRAARGRAGLPGWEVPGWTLLADPRGLSRGLLAGLAEQLVRAEQHRGAPWNDARARALSARLADVLADSPAQLLLRPGRPAQLLGLP